MRLGLLGGTFDPVHLGHLILAECAREQLQLDEVRFMPAGDPWRKAAKSGIVLTGWGTAKPGITIGSARGPA